MNKLCALLLLLIVQVEAHGQTVTTLQNLTLQSTMNAPKGVVVSCGVRFTGLTSVPGSSDDIEVVDGSIAVFLDGFTGVKGALKLGKLSEPAGQLRTSGKTIAWVRIGDGEPLAPLDGATAPGDGAGYFIFRAPTDPGFSAIQGFMEAKNLWIGFQGGTGQDRIFSGQGQMSAQTRSELAACFGELSRAPQKTK